MKRRLNLENDPKRLGKELRRIGIDAPLLDRIVENCGDDRWKNPKDAKIRKMLAEREIRLLKAERCFHALAKQLDWEERKARAVAEIVIPLYDISERPGYATYGHQSRTMEYAGILLKTLKNEKSAKAQRGIRLEEAAIKLGTLFHDIGKTTVPYDVLCAGPEVEIEGGTDFGEHPLNGILILSSVFEAEGIAKNRGAREIFQIAYMHHEHCDGSGYPEGRTKYEIFLGARIASFADAFDAMTSLRLHKTAKKLFDAIREIQGEFEQQFNGDLGLVFVNALETPENTKKLCQLIMEGGGKPF